MTGDVQRHKGVPFALDAANQVVSPYTAPRRALYTCLHCHERVTLRRGQVRVPHFAHRPDSQCTASYESLEHSAFKKLLAQGMRQHRKFTAQLRCPACEHDQRTTYNLPPDTTVEEEVAVQNYRADVALLRGEEVIFAFEVYFTHEVSGEKALALQVPWLEVAANPAGVAHPEKPPAVRVLDTNLFRHRPCKACGSQAGSKAEAEQLKLLAKEAQWRLEEEARKKAKAEHREHKRAGRRGTLLSLRTEGEPPPSWITAREQRYVNYRAPLFVTVRGCPLLVHPHLLPELSLCHAPEGIYKLKGYALHLVNHSGQESYASARLGELLTDLLAGRRVALPESLLLLEDVRRVVEAIEKMMQANTTYSEVTQPRLF